MALLFFTSGLFSCNESFDTKQLDSYPFFSFKMYFKAQENELSAKKVNLNKIIIKDGLTEEKYFDKVNWEKELKLFVDADLNKKSWVDLYRVDSIRNDSGIILRYISKDSTLRVKNATVHLAGDTVTEISIESNFRNFYYESDMYLNYIPRSGFHIQGSQTIHFASRHTFQINGQFKNESAEVKYTP